MFPKVLRLVDDKMCVRTPRLFCQEGVCTYGKTNKIPEKIYQNRTKLSGRVQKPEENTILRGVSVQNWGNREDFI